MDAFDADVLIYAAVDPEGRGAPVRALFEQVARGPVGIGSVLLLPELLSKPARLGRDAEVAVLRAHLNRLLLLPTSQEIATVAAGLGATYGLRAADSVHLATAIVAGADRFVTNNRRDFDQPIEEIEIAFPDTLDA